MTRIPPLALVTGAGVRIGRAIALELGRSGYDLILHAHHSMPALEKTAQLIRSYGQAVTLEQADFSLPDEVDSLALRVRSESRALKLLVHNAGTFERSPFREISRQQYRRMQAINLDAPFFLTQRLLPCLEAAEDPVIICIGDIAGERAMRYYAHYSVSKAGIVMFTRALAAELGPGIRVNTVSPGAVAFPEDYDERARAMILSRTPLGREGCVEDVAEAVKFLAESPYITGQVVSIDGGRSAVL